MFTYGRFRVLLSGEANRSSSAASEDSRLQTTTFRVRSCICAGLLFASGLTAQQANTFQGSVPGGPASRAPLALGLENAIQRGLKFNLGLLESQTASQTARAERIQALSALLPRVTGTL